MSMGGGCGCGAQGVASALEARKWDEVTATAGRPHLRATFTPLTLTYPSCDHPSTSPHPSLHLRSKPAETCRASTLPFFLTWTGHHLGLGSPPSPRNSGLQCKAFSCWINYGITTYPSFPIPVEPSSVAVVDCAQLREGKHRCGEAGRPLGPELQVEGPV